MPTVTSDNLDSFNKTELAKKSGTKVTSKPLADKGYQSYRYQGRYGHIMIGAKDHDDALKEAQRSTRDKVSHENLEKWDESAGKYGPLEKPSA